MAVSAALAIFATTGCAATAQAGSERDTWRSLADADERGAPSAPENPDVRGMSVKDGHGHPGQLNFDHSLQVRRSVTGVPHELHDGDQVMAGDRIRVSVQTSVDAYLYLAFCSHHELTLYPPQGALRTQAGVLMVAPPGDKELVIDDDPGREVLYVIVSAQELSVADPTLAGALMSTSPGSMHQDCGRSLDDILRPPTRPALADESATDHAPARTKSSPPEGHTQGQNTVQIQQPNLGLPDPGFARSPDDSVAAGRTGIVLARHTFTHISTMPLP
jgi:hypothetical protein